MKNVEIERKFLVDKKLLAYLKKSSIAYQKKSLQQYYTKINSQETKRFRKSDKRYFYTQKSGRGHKRAEREKEISKKEFEANKVLIKGFLVEKKRYEFSLNDRFYEFDIFDAPIDDLAFLEIEFKSEKTYHKYKVDPALKPYIMKDVSDDFRYTNASIALFKLPQELEIKKKIKPHFRSGDVIKSLLYKYLENIMIYREKILKTYADEDLHQLRINIRKSRVLIRKMGAVFEESHLAYHDNKLSIIARATNKKRDLDVFIEAFEKHFSGDLHSELRYFYHDISLQKKYEEQNLKKFLKEAALSAYLEELRLFLTKDLSRGKMAEEPIALFLEESVEAILQHIFKKTKRYKQDREEAHLHKVRISFKKLRYILESFEGLFYKRKVKELLKRVKKLQNDLGVFNDLCVQHDFLENYLQLHHLERAKESSFDTFLNKIEKDKKTVQERIEKDLEKAMDREVLREDLKVKFA